MKTVADQAIVLSRIDYGERDRILTILCQESGKISVLAKGTRVEKSKLAAGIELFSESEVSYVGGKSSLKMLTSARLKRNFENLVKDIHVINRAYEFIKIINKITDDGAGQDYYPVLATALSSLNDNSFDARIVQLWFDLQVLELAGSSPDLRPNVASAETFEFDYDKQLFLPSPEGVFSQNDLKLLRLCQNQPKPLKLQAPTGAEDRLALFSRSLLTMNVTEV